MNKKISLFYRLLAVVTTSLLTVWAISIKIDFYRILQSTRSADVSILALGFASFLLGHWLRLYRYHLMWRWPFDSNTFSVVAIHGCLSYLLPLRLGELALPSLSKYKKISNFRAAFSGLVYTRFFDFVIIILFSDVVLCVSKPEPGSWLYAQLPSLAYFSMRLSILLLAVILLLVLAYVLNRFAGLGGFRVGLFVLATCSLWVLVFLYNWLVVSALGVQIGWQSVVALVVLTAFSYFIPFQGLANLGLHEAIWYLVLTNSGLSSGDASVVAVSSHLSIFVYILLLGAIGGFLFFLNRHHNAA